MSVRVCVSVRVCEGVRVCVSVRVCEGVRECELYVRSCFESVNSYKIDLK